MGVTAINYDSMQYWGDAMPTHGLEEKKHTHTSTEVALYWRSTVEKKSLLSGGR